jgi:hypothetical protein
VIVTLAERWAGPYKITKIISSNAVELELLPTMRIHPVVNVSRVKPWKRPMEGQVLPPPPPVEVEGEKEYEVEEVLESRCHRGMTQYLVKWKGYTTEHNMWEPALNLENAQAKVKAFSIEDTSQQ